MGRYRTKLQAIQEANKQILNEITDRELESNIPDRLDIDNDNGDFDKDGDVDESDEIQKELHRAITTWFGGRMAQWVSHSGAPQEIMKDEELISKKIQQIIGDVFGGTNLLGGSRNSSYRSGMPGTW